MWITILKKGQCHKYALHQKITGMFTDEVALIGRQFCYLDKGDSVLISSFSKVNSDSKLVRFERGQKINANILISPARGTYRDEDGVRRRMAPRRNPDDIWGYVSRRFGSYANVLHARAKLMAPECVIKPDNTKIVFARWATVVELEILQPKSFEEIATKGIGAGCAFGLGLLEIING